MSKQSQIDRLWKLQKGMERKHKTPGRNATQTLGRKDEVNQKKEGQRALGKQTVPQRNNRSQLQLCGKQQEWRRPAVFPMDCLSQVGCSWKSGLHECGEETHAFMPTFFVRPSILQREGFYLLLKYLHLFFFSRKEPESLPYHTDGFPLK